MSKADPQLGFLRDLTWGHLALVVAVVIGCSLLVQITRWIVRRAAESAASHLRLMILRASPIARLLIGIAGLAIIVPLLVEPTFEDVVALLATVALALAFGLKDYVASLIAGVVTILENTYQPGDWIEIDGVYGEVKAIGTRAVHIVTADDTEVIVPHAKIWSGSVANDSGGQRSLLAVTHIYLHADHDGAAVRQALTEIAETSALRKPETPVKVMAAEAPFATHYKIKAYVADSRQQFAMVTELTLRAKDRLRAMHVAYAQAPYARPGG
ncbi:mechanosensitive ion channel family protein [Phenylobacterium sp.]|jgi:small-conductance mechanosensitive channel|uniref:mechanosensitive ion channel family protein n=1 Tax=Phenylobacterium sp. TaxID=1871053 RepID=UPI002E370D1C|nr:mechanosensitive ion channel domain-containing protein [Phenylobacterium sp.]HEX3365009.1 mechanosensitive ion channel domain-containing protein [Phenylobacterium sp.]